MEVRNSNCKFVNLPSYIQVWCACRLALKLKPPSGLEQTICSTTYVFCHAVYHQIKHVSWINYYQRYIHTHTCEYGECDFSSFWILLSKCTITSFLISRVSLRLQISCSIIICCSSVQNQNTIKYIHVYKNGQQWHETMQDESEYRCL